jgi:hypothetical protein
MPIGYRYTTTSSVLQTQRNAVVVLRRLLVQACASRVGDLVFYFSLPSAEQCPQKAGKVIQLMLERSNGTCALVCCFPDRRLLNQAPRSVVKLKSVVRFLLSFTSCCSDVRFNNRYRYFCIFFSWIKVFYAIVFEFCLRFKGLGFPVSVASKVPTICTQYIFSLC